MSIAHWEPALAPWHVDAFPDEFKDQISNRGERRMGWMAIDTFGNPIGWVLNKPEELVAV